MNILSTIYTEDDLLVDMMEEAQYTEDDLYVDMMEEAQYTEDDILFDMVEEAQTQVRLYCCFVQKVYRRVVGKFEKLNYVWYK